MFVKNDLFQSRYKVKKFLGKGTFGTVFKVYDTQLKKNLALKMIKEGQGSFENEVKNLTILSDSSGFPRIYDHGYSQSYYYILFELLDKTLNQVFRKFESKFSPECIFNIALQTLTRIEELHKMGLIHQDLKPDNFMIGQSKKNLSSIVYLVDLGLSFQYKSSDTSFHIDYHETRRVVGNLRYASINNHRGVQQTRRDDLESWFYLICYLFDSKLPWDLEVLNKNNEEIYKIKRSLPLTSFCQNGPKELSDLLCYIRSLQFSEKPDYTYIREKILKISQVPLNRLKLDWVSEVSYRKAFLKISRRRKRNKKEWLSVSKLPTMKSWVQGSSSRDGQLNSSFRFLKKVFTREEDRVGFNNDETLKGELPAFEKKSSAYKKG